MWLCGALAAHGLTENEVSTLLRCERTLRRWAERECGDGSDWAIEREEGFRVALPGGRWAEHATEQAAREHAEAIFRKTGAIVAVERYTDGRPYNVYHGPGLGGVRRYPIADLETSALKRAHAIAEAHGLVAYHQGDPRGCALYILRPGDVPEGQCASGYYDRGIAVCID